MVDTAERDPDVIRGLTMRLAHTTVWKLDHWEPVVKRALLTGFTPDWLLDAGPKVGPNGIDEACNAANGGH